MADMMQELQNPCPVHGRSGCAHCAENLPGPTFQGAGHNWPVGGVDRCGGAVISPPLRTEIPKKEQFPPGAEGERDFVEALCEVLPAAPHGSSYYVWPAFVLKLLELDMILHKAVLAAIAASSVAISIGESIKPRLSPEVIKLDPIRKACTS